MQSTSENDNSPADEKPIQMTGSLIRVYAACKSVSPRWLNGYSCEPNVERCLGTNMT